MPQNLHSDNGPEFTGQALDQGTDSAGMQLVFIRSGRPIENGHLESLNGRFREECMNALAFRTLAEAREALMSDGRLITRPRPAPRLAD